MPTATLTKWWVIDILPKETSAMQEFLAYNPTQNRNVLTKVIMLLDVKVQSVVIIQISHLKTKTEKESKKITFYLSSATVNFLEMDLLHIRECLVVFVHNWIKFWERLFNYII